MIENADFSVSVFAVGLDWLLTPPTQHLLYTKQAEKAMWEQRP